MSVQPIYEWRRAGCSDECSPRSHNPSAHEAYGRALERGAQRSAVVCTGALTIDLRQRTVRVADREIHLAPLEWALLAFYAERIGRWCLQSEIQHVLWRDMAASTTVSTVRWRLRTALGEAGGLIERRQSGRSTRWTRLALMEPTL